MGCCSASRDGFRADSVNCSERRPTSAARGQESWIILRMDLAQPSECANRKLGSRFGYHGLGLCGSTDRKAESTEPKRGVREETPLRTDDARMARPVAPETSSVVAGACSQDRLELYLTHNRRFWYTLSRLARHFPDSGRGFWKRVPHPYVRLYALPPEQLPRTGRVEPVTALRSASSSELLLADVVEGCWLSLGIKIRELEPGHYKAVLLVSGAAGTDSAVRETPFEVGCPNVEWVLPPAEVWLAAGGQLRVALDQMEQGRQSRIYESLSIRVGNEASPMRQSYILGKAGTRALDLILAASAIVALGIPIAIILLYIRSQVVRRFPEVAAARQSAAKGLIRRFLAPALYRDDSRWTWQDGRLAQGPIFKFETLTPNKRPILGRTSVLMRGWGVDEWPQLFTVFRGGWALFGPRSVPNRDGLLAPDGATMQNSRDLEARYCVEGEARKPGALSLRMAMTPRGMIELPPWRTMLLYDRYDCTHWSLLHALRVVGRLVLSFLWAEALNEHDGPTDTRLARLASRPGDLGGGES